MLKLPVGRDNFRELIDNQLDFVDKSLLIKEILNESNTKVIVITRPRRFGKTLNLSMLHHFLAAEAYGFSTEHLFEGLKINAAGEKYLRHHRHYPVIFITFKGVKDHNYKTAYAQLCSLMRKVYDEHRYVLAGSSMTPEDRARFESILREQPAATVLESALEDLCRYLSQHHGVNPWLLIDEYDTPIQSAYLHGYYEEMITLMRNVFGSALKTNAYLDRSVVTGILRISKESLFSDVNNLKVYTVLNSKYGEYFGFTEDEVTTLLQKAHLGDKSAEIRHWYNGYRIGKITVYNPWSIVNFFTNDGELKPYWVNTSGNDLVRKLLAQGDEDLKKQLECIIRGESFEETIDENIVFKDLDRNADAVWSLLLFSGYLKVLASEPQKTRVKCQLAAPNYEVLALYENIIHDWMAGTGGRREYENFISSLVEGRTEEFAARLEKYLRQTMSTFDPSGQEPEKFYHGLVLGMIISLSETHEVNSNRESGYGRYDVMLIPKDPKKLGIILEFKVATAKEASLEISAQKALEQIQQRDYAATLRQRGIEKILQIGLAFKGKEIAIVFGEE